MKYLTSFLLVLVACYPSGTEEHWHLRCTEYGGRVVVDTSDVDGRVWNGDQSWYWTAEDDTFREVSASSMSCVAERHRVQKGAPCSCPEHEIMDLFPDVESLKAERE